MAFWECSLMQVHRMQAQGARQEPCRALALLFEADGGEQLFLFFSFLITNSPSSKYVCGETLLVVHFSRHRFFPFSETTNPQSIHNKIVYKIKIIILITTTLSVCVCKTYLLIFSYHVTHNPPQLDEAFPETLEK